MAAEPSTTPDLPLSTTPLDRPELYEVIDGAVVEKPAMGAFEVFLAGELMRELGGFVHEARLGSVVMEMLFVLRPTPKLMRRPDLAFVSAERWPLGGRIPRTEAWDVIPDLAIEVVSRSNSADDVALKIESYFDAGVRQVWVIYPVTSKVHVYHSPTEVKILQLGDDLQGEPMIPGFRLPLASLFGEAAGD